MRSGEKKIIMIKINKKLEMIITLNEFPMPRGLNMESINNNELKSRKENSAIMEVVLVEPTNKMNEIIKMK